MKPNLNTFQKLVSLVAIPAIAGVLHSNPAKAADKDDVERRSPLSIQQAEQGLTEEYLSTWIGLYRDLAGEGDILKSRGGLREYLEERNTYFSHLPSDLAYKIMQNGGLGLWEWIRLAALEAEQLDRREKDSSLPDFIEDFLSDVETIPEQAEYWFDEELVDVNSEERSGMREFYLKLSPYQQTFFRLQPPDKFSLQTVYAIYKVQERRGDPRTFVDVWMFIQTLEGETFTPYTVHLVDGEVEVDESPQPEEELSTDEIPDTDLQAIYDQWQVEYRGYVEGNNGLILMFEYFKGMSPDVRAQVIQAGGLDAFVWLVYIRGGVNNDPVEGVDEFVTEFLRNNSVDDDQIEQWISVRGSIDERLNNFLRGLTPLQRAYVLQNKVLLLTSLASQVPADKSAQEFLDELIIVEFASGSIGASYLLEPFEVHTIEDRVHGSIPEEFADIPGITALQILAQSFDRENGTNYEKVIFDFLFGQVLAEDVIGEQMSDLRFQHTTEDRDDYTQVLLSVYNSSLSVEQKMNILDTLMRNMEFNVMLPRYASVDTITLEQYIQTHDATTLAGGGRRVRSVPRVEDGNVIFTANGDVGVEILLVVFDRKHSNTGAWYMVKFPDGSVGFMNYTVVGFSY